MGSESQLGADGAALVVMAAVADIGAYVLASQAYGVKATVFHLRLGQAPALKGGDEPGMGCGEGHPR